MEAKFEYNQTNTRTCMLYYFGVYFQFCDIKEILDNFCDIKGKGICFEKFEEL